MSRSLQKLIARSRLASGIRHSLIFEVTGTVPVCRADQCDATNVGEQVLSLGTVLT